MDVHEDHVVGAPPRRLDGLAALGGLVGPLLLFERSRGFVPSLAAEPQGDTAGYDTRVARFRLRQAFGRLIRSKDDAGHFIMLSPAFPSRLLSAFPKGTPVLRVTLDEALQRLAAGVLHKQTERAGGAFQS